MTSALIKLIFGITLIVIAVAFGPLVGIWALNTLFPVLAIPYTWQTWLAYFFLIAPITGLRLGFKKK
jgi:hypothetical protein